MKRTRSRPSHVLSNAVKPECPDDVSGSESRHFDDSVRSRIILTAVMADQKLGDAVAFLGKLHPPDADALLADQLYALVTMGFVLTLRVTANVVQKAEVDQDLLILLGKVHTRMLAIDQRQK